MKKNKLLTAAIATLVLCSSYLFSKSSVNPLLSFDNPEALTSTECTIKMGETVVVCLGDEKNKCHEKYNGINIYCDGTKVQQ